MELDILEEFGLNEKESKIYFTLLREKSCTASGLAGLININRTTAYLELDNLLRLGLVSYVIKDSKRYYQAAHPEKLLEILDTKKAKIESILPMLKGLHKSPQPFKIETYEGRQGIKTFYQDILNTAAEVLVFGATGKAVEILKFSYPHFLKKFMNANIKERALANMQAKKIMEAHPKSHIQVKYLPKKYKADVTTVLYHNKVAIQSLQEDNLYVVMITDELLYKSYRNYFEFMWDMV